MSRYQIIYSTFWSTTFIQIRKGWSTMTTSNKKLIATVIFSMMSLIGLIGYIAGNTSVIFLGAMTYFLSLIFNNQLSKDVFPYVCLLIGFGLYTLFFTKYSIMEPIAVMLSLSGAFTLSITMVPFMKIFKKVKPRQTNFHRLEVVRSKPVIYLSKTA